MLAQHVLVQRYAHSFSRSTITTTKSAAGITRTQRQVKQTMEATSPAADLTTLQRLYFWLGALAPIPSILLYVIVPGGTVEFFGGTSSPSADFWCSIAASGDAVVVALCWCVLKNPNDMVLRQSVLWTNAIYSLFHFGGFARAHYMMEPQPMGPFMYIVNILIFWAAYLAWGRSNNARSENTAPSAYRHHPTAPEYYQ
jgi:hypothetical protein